MKHVIPQLQGLLFLGSNYRIPDHFKTLTLTLTQTLILTLTLILCGQVFYNCTVPGIVNHIMHETIVIHKAI